MVQDLVPDLPDACRAHHVAVAEGHHAHQGLEGDDPECPNVALGANLAAETFWRHVLRGARDAVQPAAGPGASGAAVEPAGGLRLRLRGLREMPALAQAEVQQLEVAGGADHD
eukprot:CAMPEP_0170341714 /NCGR_PEP_ID=MMETSP0116_2-20130129/71983_1 /TAXON_ID=400756 /ORGANISM="Durinskia baltica, Strain CSIRO CS-38" /LENGTH=112 /DNA_ID=CAMNT_0010595269 /DNA_START=414 /DNA_END=749 /DNA_ORIENTATION=+